jgi:hypothetical protein
VKRKAEAVEVSETDDTESLDTDSAESARGPNVEAGV